MKRTALLVTALTLASTAAADQIGFFLLGGQYQQDNGVRYGVGLPIIGLFGGAGVVSVSGDVSYLIPAGAQNSTVAPYYGFGLGASLTVASAGGSGLGLVTLTPNVLAGLNFNTSGTFSPFVEGSLSPTFAFGGATEGGTGGGVLGVGFGLRLGVNYRLD